MSKETTHRKPIRLVTVLITIGLLLAGLLPIFGAQGQDRQEHAFSHGDLPPGWETDEGTYQQTFAGFVKWVDHPWVAADAHIEVLFAGVGFTMSECIDVVSEPSEPEPESYNTLHVRPIGALDVREQEFGGWPAIIAEAEGELTVLLPPGPDRAEPVLESFGPIDGIEICVDTPNGVYVVFAAARPSARAETDEFLNTFRFGGENRHLTVTAFDGTDNRRYPLMFDLLFEKDSGEEIPPREPLAGQQIYWRISNQASSCFKHHYDAWDPRTWAWVRREHRGQLDSHDDLGIVTGADGRAYLRLYYSFDGIKAGGSGSRCSLPIDIEVAFSAPARDFDPEIDEFEPPMMVSQKATLTLSYAAFVTSVHADIPNRTTYITDPDSPTPLPPQGWFNILDYTEEQQRRVYSRILIDDQPFVPPVPGASRFVLPLPLGTTDRPGAVLTLDTSFRFRPVSGETTEWSPDPGTAIGVEVMWIDGSRAILIAKNRENIRSPEVHIVIAPVISDLQHLDPGYAFLYFLGTNGLEFAAQGATVLGATAINPALGAWVAGAWAIYEFYDTPKDAYEIGEILSRNGYMIIVQSEVALTLADDGTHTVYTYEGAPAVYQDGVLTQAFAGDAIDVSPEWTVGPAVQRDPPESAQELRALLAAAGAPGEVDDPTIIEPGARFEPGQDDPATSVVPSPTAVPGGTSSTQTTGDDGGATLVIIAIGLAFIGSMILIAILRSRKPPLTPQTAAGPLRPAPPIQSPSGHGQRWQPQPYAPATPPAGRATPHPSAAPAAPPRAAPTSPGTKCVVCGSALSADARFCGMCGATIPVPPQPEPEAVRYCTRCGSRLSPGARFCMACGAPQVATAETTRQPTPPPF